MRQYCHVITPLKAKTRCATQMVATCRIAAECELFSRIHQECQRALHLTHSSVDLHESQHLNRFSRFCRVTNMRPTYTDSYDADNATIWVD